MKCPGCGNESGSDPICSKCDFTDAGDKDKIEVEYKDFKTSELLEIRQMRQTTPTVKKAIAEGKLKIQDIKYPLFDNRKRRFPVVAMVALLFALMSLAYFFFRNCLSK